MTPTSDALEAGLVAAKLLSGAILLLAALLVALGWLDGHDR